MGWNIDTYLSLELLITCDGTVRVKSMLVMPS